MSLSRIAAALLVAIPLAHPSLHAEGRLSISYAGGLVVGQVGSVASVRATIVNDTNEVKEFTVRPTSQPYNLMFWRAKCGAGATSSVTAARLMPGERLPVTFLTAPQENPNACYQGFRIEIGNTIIADAVIRPVIQPAGWYNASTDFENADSLDTISFGGATFESKPADTCAVTSSSTYSAFPNLGGKAVVCWGDSLVVRFGPGVRHAGFVGAGPPTGEFIKAGLSVKTTFASPDGTTRELSTPPTYVYGSGIHGNVILPSWLECAAFVTNDLTYYGAPAASDLVIKEMTISHPDHQAFIVDNLAVLGPAPAVPAPASVQWVSPRQAPAGSVIEIHGSAFATNVGVNPFPTTELLPPLVRIGGKPAEVVSITPTAISAVVPSLASGAASIEVIAADGRSSGVAEHLFTVGPVPPRRRAIDH